MPENKSPESPLRRRHLAQREQSEKDFFGLFVETSPDNSNPEWISRGEINSEQRVGEIINLNPDLIIAYGCSIIKAPLLDAFEGRILNVHLGLSPYYRGSGTNFWPFVNNELEYIGATFMYMDKGIDTGEVIHQIRPKIVPGDSIHQIGNRLILDVGKTYRELVVHFEELTRMQQLPAPAEAKYYRRKDFREDTVARAYGNLDEGLVERYLSEQESRRRNVPIITNAFFG